MGMRDGVVLRVKFKWPSSWEKRIVVRAKMS